jgi:SAM-dependent methyltransferase
MSGSTPVPPSEPGVHPAHSFDDIYAAERPPAWDIGRPQPGFEQLAEDGGLVGRVLDAGCGTGEHALMAASLGFEAVGIDVSERAIALAKQKSDERSVPARFIVADALSLADLGEHFETVLDCGLFHVLGDDERERYVASLADVVPSGGQLHLLCFSDQQPGEWGPRRVTQDEIRFSLVAYWDVETIQPSIIDLTWNPDGALAWLVAATRG